MFEVRSTIISDGPDDLAEYVVPGQTVVIPADYGGAPAEIMRCVVRRGITGLSLVGGPPSGYVADLLIGAGCVSAVEMPGVILGDFGLAPRFRKAVSTGAIRVTDTTCPAFHASIAATQKGLPFMPMRGLLGSDILRNRPEWKSVVNPYQDKHRDGDDRIVLIPAFSPDIVVFHAQYGDRHGNVWIGKEFEVRAMAQAAKFVIASFEHWYDGDLLDDPRMAPSTIAHIYINATAPAPKGAWPVAFADEYGFDADHMQNYARAARDDVSFQEYLDCYVYAEGRSVAGRGAE